MRLKHTGVTEHIFSTVNLDAFQRVPIARKEDVHADSQEELEELLCQEPARLEEVDD